MQTNDPMSMFLAFLFSGGGLMWLGNGMRNYLNGRASAEKERNKLALEEARTNDRKADLEARNRRLLEEYASQLRRILLEAGVSEIPDFPKLDKYEDD